MKQIEINGIKYDNYITQDGRVLNKSGIERKYKYKKYKYVSLCKDGSQLFISIHRILAIHYIPNPENKEQVNHIDGDKLNNNLDNLEWVTRSENTKHAYKLGLMRRKFGSDNPNWKGGVKTTKQT